MSGEKACRLIEEGVAKGIEKASECIVDLPEKFEFEVNFKDCVRALRSSYYPGAEQIDEKTVRYVTDNVHDMMTARMFIL